VKKENDLYWITWETQRRNVELASAFKCNYFPLDYSRENKIIRYLKSSIKTVALLFNRPKIVFVQCPSIVLCVLCAIFKSLFNYTLVVDAHNYIIRYLEDSNFIVKSFTKYILDKCDFIILTNVGFAKSLPVESKKVLILPDKLPKMIEKKEKPKAFSNTKQNIILISSFAKDEPIEAFIKAAESYTDKCKFFITGKKSKAKELLNYESESMVFTDFLDIEEFENYISHSNLNVDLTTEDNLLVCGAYETLAVGVPGMISDTEINRQTFKNGFVYSKVDVESIKLSLKGFFKREKELKSKINDYKAAFNSDWQKHFDKCLQLVGDS